MAVVAWADDAASDGGQAAVARRPVDRDGAVVSGLRVDAMSRPDSKAIDAVAQQLAIRDGVIERYLYGRYYYEKKFKVSDLTYSEYQDVSYKMIRDLRRSGFDVVRLDAAKPIVSICQTGGPVEQVPGKTAAAELPRACVDMAGPTDTGSAPDCPAIRTISGVTL